METVALKIADQNAAIRYLGEVQSRPLDPIHEPIQNLLDEDARKIEIHLEPRRKKIRFVGDSRPILTVEEARRILQSICRSKKRGKLGEKGIGMLSFVNAGEWMVTKSNHQGKEIWIKLHRENLDRGEVHSAKSRSPSLPSGRTEITIGGVPSNYFKARFSAERIARGIRRRWALLMRQGVQISINGRVVHPDEEELQGTTYQKDIKVRAIRGRIVVDLVVLHRPSDAALVSVTHKGQANFEIGSIPIFTGSVFTLGWLHGTITGDIAPINASRTGFKETREFELWQDAVMEVHDELERLVAERSRSAAEARDQGLIDEFMRYLKAIFAGTDLSSVTSVVGEGEELGWEEPRGESKGDGNGTGGTSGRQVAGPPRKGESGRLPTVPHGGFGEFAPSIRVWRGRREFKINVKHPDYMLALKHPQKRRDYIREICLQEAYIYSLDGRRRSQMEEFSDELMGYWTKVFVESLRSRL